MREVYIWLPVHTVSDAMRYVSGSMRTMHTEYCFIDDGRMFTVQAIVKFIKCPHSIFNYLMRKMS